VNDFVVIFIVPPYDISFKGKKNKHISRYYTESTLKLLAKIHPDQLKYFSVLFSLWVIVYWLFLLFAGVRIT